MRRAVFMLETLAVVNKHGQAVDLARRPIFRKSWCHLRVLIRDNVPAWWRAPVFTDGWAGHLKLSGTNAHETVNHSKMFVSRRGVSTNNLEGFHAHVKRAVPKQGYATQSAQFEPAASSLALPKPRHAEYAGDSAVWMFRAIASAVSTGISADGDPEVERKACNAKVVAVARADGQIGQRLN